MKRVESTLGAFRVNPIELGGTRPVQWPSIWSDPSAPPQLEQALEELQELQELSWYDRHTELAMDGYSRRFMEQ